MLEGALEAVMQELGAEITELIDIAVPALDALVTRVSSACLPRCLLSPAALVHSQPTLVAAYAECQSSVREAHMTFSAHMQFLLLAAHSM